MFAQLLKPPTLRAHDENSRHATWLELFFDLVLVAAIAQVGHTLVSAATLAEGLIYLGLIWIIFWVWCGHTIYSTRFDTDDPVFRILTFLNMFTLIVMAVEVHNAAHGHGFVFALAFLGSRLILLLLLARAYYHAKIARNILRIYLFGFSAGAVIWASSLGFHGATAIWIWAFALGLEATVPWIIWRMPSGENNISAEHIPERFGLFTIIVLGENVFAVVKGLEPLNWTLQAIITAGLSFVIAASIWWVYFQHIERMIGRIKLGSGQPYIYSHFPLLAGIVAVGIGTLRLISETSQPYVSAATLAILVGGYALWWIGGVLLHFISCRQEALSRTAFSRNISIAVLLMAVGFFGQTQTSVVVAIMVCGISLLYAGWDSAARRQTRAQGTME